MLEKEYSTIYWPQVIKEAKDTTLNVLQAIDCNLSKLLHALLYSIFLVSLHVDKNNKNYRHYDWYIVVVDKETGEQYGGPEENEKGQATNRFDST